MSSSSSVAGEEPSEMYVEINGEKYPLSELSMGVKIP